MSDRKADWTKLLQHVAESGNLSKACRETGLSKSTFLDHVNADPKLADQYARAREIGLDAEADRAIEEALQAQDAGLGRLALDARKWYLSKLLPKKFGDKMHTELTGKDGGPIRTETTDVSKLSEDELRAIAAGK